MLKFLVLILAFFQFSCQTPTRMVAQKRIDQPGQFYVNLVLLSREMAKKSKETFDAKKYEGAWYRAEEDQQIWYSATESISEKERKAEKFEDWFEKSNTLKTKAALDIYKEPIQAFNLEYKASAGFYKNTLNGSPYSVAEGLLVKPGQYSPMFCAVFKPEEVKNISRMVGQKPASDFLVCHMPSLKETETYLEDENDPDSEEKTESYTLQERLLSIRGSYYVYVRKQ